MKRARRSVLEMHEVLSSTPTNEQVKVKKARVAFTPVLKGGLAEGE